LAGFYGLVASGLLAALHTIEYRHLQLGQGLFIQGRYLLPLVPLAAALAALVLGRLPGRVRAIGLGSACALMFALQLLAIGTEMGRFYA
jgi:hypothetical protein